MTTEFILTLAIGRFNSVLCWHAPESSGSQFRSIRLTPEGFRPELICEPVTGVVDNFARAERIHAIVKPESNRPIVDGRFGQQGAEPACYFKWRKIRPRISLISAACSGTGDSPKSSTTLSANPSSNSRVFEYFLGTPSG